MTYRLFPIVLIFAISHIKAITCSHDRCDSLPYWRSPPYIDPEDRFSSEVVRTFNVLLKDYFPASFKETKTKETAFKDYLIEIENLEKSKNLIPTVASRLKDPLLRNYMAPCQSNTLENALRFLKAVFSDPRVKGGHQDLIQLRHELLSVCGTRDEKDVLLDAIRNLDESKVGGYKHYLLAIYYFYTQEYEKALVIFSALKKGSESFFQRILRFFSKFDTDDWLRETASYMEARTLLIHAQKNWDGYEYELRQKNAVDQEMVKRSLHFFKAYLKEYPKGLYSDSAKNIQRKIFYLLGEHDQLDKSLRETINQHLLAHEKGEEKLLQDSSNINDLISEFRTHFSGSIDPAVDSPILIAFSVLKRTPPSLELVSTLEAQESRFSAYPGLFQFLRAWVLYKLGSFQELLDKTVMPLSLSSYDGVKKSLELLRARSLKAVKKYDQSLETFTKMLHGIKKELSTHLQVEIMCLQVERGNTLDLFTSHLFIEDDILTDVAKFGLSDQELIKFLENKNLKANARSVLAHELMRRYLMTGRLKEALALYNKTDKLYLKQFLHIKSSIINLIRAPEDSRYLIAFAKELYDLPLFQEDTCINGCLVEDVINDRCEFPGDSSDNKVFEFCQFSGLSNAKKILERKVYSSKFVPPVVYFLRVVKNYDKRKEKSEFEAEALHYLIKYCFHGYWPALGCKWGRDFKDDSPRWFRRLHTKYKGTSWAKQTPYYY